MRKKFLAVLCCALLTGLATPVSAEEAGDEAKIEEGATIYENYCATCHGWSCRTTAASRSTCGACMPTSTRASSTRYYMEAGDAGVGRTLTAEQIEGLWIYVRANANDTK